MKRAALAALVLALGSVATPLAQDGVIIEQVIVKVNGDIFTKGDLEQEQIAALRKQNQQVRLPAQLTDAALKPILAGMTPDILVDAVDQLLLVQRGRELGFEVTDAQFKEAIDGLKTDNKLTTDDMFQAALKQEGMTLADLRNQLEKSILIRKVQQAEVMPKVALTDVEAQEYYKTHQSEFLKPATIVLREILISVPMTTQGGQPVINAGAADDARDKLNAILERIKKGEDFATVAKEVSESPSKANGGLLPAINEADLAKDVRDVFDKLKIGDVTEPTLTTRGYQVFKLESRTETVPEEFEKVREQIVDNVSNDRLDVEMKKYVDKLRSQAIIEWKNDDFKKLYEQKLAARDK